MDWLGYATALTPVLGLAVNALAHVIIHRALGRWGMLRSVVISFVAGGMFVAAADVCYLGGRVGGPDAYAMALMDLLTYGALGYGYFHFVNLGTTARRVRLLMELREAPEGVGYEREEFIRRYGAREMVQKRLGRMLDSGQIVQRGGRFYIGAPVLLTMARAMRGLKVLILGRSSEFDGR